MRRAVLAALLLVGLTGCGWRDILPTSREIEDMVLVQTMGVDGGADECIVTASGGGREGKPAQVVSGQAGSLSAAVLTVQGEGPSYLYFGHVAQLLLGEELAAEGVGPALDYILRDVETRLDTALYLVRGGTAGEAIRAAAEDGSAAQRLDTMAEEAGLLAFSMPRTVKDVMADQYAQGASFAPALLADGKLGAVGYGILKEDALVGWAEGEVALGVSLALGQVEADVVELGSDTVRVVHARTKVRPIVEDGTVTGLSVRCRVEANLAEGTADLADPEQVARLEEALAQREQARLEAALSLAKELDADYLGLRSHAALAAPWHKDQLEGEKSLAGLDLEAEVQAKLRRSYEAD